MATRIINEVKGINRVVYDVTSKPPGTLSGSDTAEMTELWGTLTSANWRSAPTVRGRVATEADVQAGRAVFCIPIGSKPYPLSLPACAIHRDAEAGQATSIVVIQAEEAPGQIVLGARPLEGGNVVCTLAEVELVQDPDERFFCQA